MLDRVQKNMDDALEKLLAVEKTHRLVRASVGHPPRSIGCRHSTRLIATDAVVEVGGRVVGLFPQQGDAIATKKVCVAVVQVCFAAAKWRELNEHIVLLSKRRSQLKQAVTGMVQEAMTYIDQVRAQSRARISATSIISAAHDRRPSLKTHVAQLLSQALDCGL
jgi:hypothetical protein